VRRASAVSAQCSGEETLRCDIDGPNLRPWPPIDDAHASVADLFHHAVGPDGTALSRIGHRRNQTGREALRSQESQGSSHSTRASAQHILQASLRSSAFRPTRLIEIGCALLVRPGASRLPANDLLSAPTSVQPSRRRTSGDLKIQPLLSQWSISRFNQCGRHAQHFSCLFDRQAGEESQLYDPALLGSSLARVFKASSTREYIQVGLPRVTASFLVEWKVSVTCAATFAARPTHERNRPKIRRINWAEPLRKKLGCGSANLRPFDLSAGHKLRATRPHSARCGRDVSRFR